jgi:hypothetical protein
MVILSKVRQTRVDVISLVAGVYEILERDAKGKPTKRKWHPQTQKNAKGETVPIVVQVPIEEQFNNGKGVGFYLEKGYKYLDEAEDLLEKIKGITFVRSGVKVGRPADTVVEDVIEENSEIDNQGGAVLTAKNDVERVEPEETPIVTKPKRAYNRKK